MVDHAQDLRTPSSAQPRTSPQHDRTAPAGVSAAAPPSRGDSARWRLAFRAGERRMESYDRSRAHYRECRRRELDVPLDLEIISPDGTVFGRGTARLVNMSASGALLADVHLDSGRYPVGPFRVLSQLKGGVADGILIRCHPVRVDQTRGGLGVLIEDIDCAAER